MAMDGSNRRGSTLVTYAAARRALAEARSIPEIKEIRDKMEGLRTFARLAKDRDLEMYALETRVRAERRLGQLLIEIKAGDGLSTGAMGIGTSAVPSSDRTLAELGISKNQSARAQRYAAIDDAEFERRIAEGREEMALSTARTFSNLLKAIARPAAKPAGPLPDGRFRVILADPPWAYRTYSDAGKDRGAENHYPTLSLEEIAALDVGSLAADDAALFLWVTGPFLVAGLHLPVIEAWGFKVSSMAFVWIKTNGDGTFFAGNGYGTRANAEVCVLARRGSPKRASADVKQVIETQRREHSAKPFEAYDRVEELFAGPYVELFARETRPGWTSWGDEIGDAPEQPREAAD